MGKWLIIGLMALAGCENTLETGYKPTVLNASDSQRKAFYAPAFSPAAREAADDPSKGNDVRRPGSHY